MSRITDWPDLDPGVVKVTPVDEGTVLYSIGRGRRTKHLVLTEVEAAATWAELDKAFGFTAKARKLKSA